MEKFTDRILIYLFCMMFVYLYDMSMVSIIAMLVSIIITSFEIFFDCRSVSAGLHFLYFVVVMMYPEFAGFVPVMVYNVICRRDNKFILFYFVPFLKYVLAMPYIAALLSLACCLAVRENHVQDSRRKFLEIQERNLWLELMLKKEQAEMLKHQDYEIRMATVNERNRIAREIHDNVGHMLSRSILQVGAMQTTNNSEQLKEPLELLQDTLQSAMTSIRESVHDLKDESVDLKLMVDSIICEYETLSVSLDYDIDSEMPKDLKYCFLSIIKEALTNVVKHSNADKVSIVIREHPGLFQLLFFDNGSIEPEMNRSGIGLENMRERVAALDGYVRFAFENGFRIFVSVGK